MGLLSENRKEEGLALGLSISDNVTLSAFGSVSRLGWVLPHLQKTKVGRWVDRMKIKCRSGSQPVKDLSGGNQQKVALARLLHQKADVILLDEPTRGIDVGAKAEIHALMDHLAGKGKAILLISSDLPEVLGMSNRVLVMDRGTLSAELSGEQMTQANVILAASGFYSSSGLVRTSDEE